MMKSNLQFDHEMLQNAITEIDEYAIILLNPEGDIIEWNTGAEKIKGYSADEIIGKNFKKFYTLNDINLKKPDVLLQQAKTFGKANDEGWRIKKDGTTFWASVVITAVHNDAGRLIGYSKVTRDLTLKKQYEDHLNRINNAISDVSDYAIILLNKDGIIQNWNKGAQNIKGYEADEIIGKSFTQFYLDEDIALNRPFQLLNEATINGKAHEEGLRKRKDGSTFWAHVTIYPVKNLEGEMTGFSKVTRDLTEKKTAETERLKYISEIENKNHELEQFAYIASHDLQEPLRTISSLTSLLSLSYKDCIDQEGVKMMDYLQDASSRMTNLITGLLEYSRIGKDRSFSKVNTSEMINGVIADLDSRIKAQKAEIIINKLPNIVASDLEIRQLFQNLISNGVKFHKPDSTPKVEISATENESEWVFEVKDNGIGIPEEDQESIFMIYKRLHPREKFEGTGIGLAHCKKITEVHQGKIWIESEPNKGSSFFFSIKKGLNKKG